MSERRRKTSSEPEGCPAWCVGQHTALDHPEDAVHQSVPVHVALVSGRPWLGAGPRGVPVVARLVRQPGQLLTWLDVAGEDDPTIRITVTAESGRQLVDALHGLLRLDEA